MVTLSSLRKYPLIRLGLLGLLGVSLFALGGCGKMETSTQAPSPAAPPAEKSAIPNSFDAVAAQLDTGGEFYLYLSTAQWLGKLSQGIDTLHGIVLSGSASQSAPGREQAENAFAVIKDIIQKSGIEDVTGVGASSFAISPGLYRNKIFVHHNPDKGSGIFWTMYGKEPHPLAGLDLLPADTAAAGYGDCDLAQLIDFLRQEVDASGIPEAKQAVDKWQAQFAGVSGLKLDDVLGSLNGSMGMVLTLDATSTISVPIKNRSETIPTPRLALVIAVKNDLIFKQVDKMAGSNPGIIKVDEPDLRMRTMRIPALPALNLRPTVAQWNGYLVIATDDKLIREMIAVQKGAPGFTSTPEYATLSAGLPEKGNRFGLTTERFAESLTKFQGEMFANQPGATQVQAALLQRLFSNQKNVHTFCISTHLPDGWLLVSQGSQGSSQLLAPLVIAPAAIIAGVTIPAISGAHQKTAEAKSLSNAKQLCLACKNYAIDNGGNFPPSLDALFPTYLTNRSVLASPLMPGQPLGYAYTPGLKVTDAANTVIIEDTFAPLKHVRIVAYVDGSACILGTPAGATFSPSPSENPPSPPVTP